MKSTEAIPLVTSQPVMVRVTAPSNLEGGYTFDAVYNGEVFPVTVPAGGVRSGQSFEVPFVPINKAVAVATVVDLPEDEATSETAPMLRTAQSADGSDAGGGAGNSNPRTVPLGEFKTGLCDCFQHGFLHPSVLNAWCCPQILMAQVLTRMKLGFCGLPVPESRYRNTTAAWMLACLVVGYYRLKWKGCADLDTVSSSHVETLKVLVDSHGNEKVLNREVNEAIGGSHCTKSMRNNLQLLNWIWFWLTVVVLARLRKAVRQAHAIRGYTDFGWFEDLFCAFYCGFCTVSQLARETANYDTERAYYFSKTGMADEWSDRFEAFEQRHRDGHHLVHAHPAGDKPHVHTADGETHVV